MFNRDLANLFKHVDPSEPFTLSDRIYIYAQPEEEQEEEEQQQLLPALALTNPCPQMPLELYIKIFSNLSIRDFLSVTFVTTYFNSQEIWQGMLISHFPTYNNELELSKEPNLHFKSEYKQNLAKLNFPNIYLSKTQQKINDIYNRQKIDFVTLIQINGMNERQQKTIEDLLFFIIDNTQSAFTSMSFFSSAIKNKNNHREMKTASALLKVALEKDCESILNECADILIEDIYDNDAIYNEKLASIYSSLIEAGLISGNIKRPQSRYLNMTF